jgi:hypothetical protein
MIAMETVAEIERLLGEGNLSQRKIALLTGVSRGSVGLIASGKRPDREILQEPAEDNADEPVGPPQRCAGCGGLVYMPCRLCRERERLAEKSGRSPQRRSFEPNDGPALTLRSEHQARYQEVRRWRRAHEGRPMEGRAAR